MLALTLFRSTEIEYRLKRSQKVFHGLGVLHNDHNVWQNSRATFSDVGVFIISFQGRHNKFSKGYFVINLVSNSLIYGAAFRMDLNPSSRPSFSSLTRASDGKIIQIGSEQGGIGEREKKFILPSAPAFLSCRGFLVRSIHRALQNLGTEKETARSLSTPLISRTSN